MREASSEPKENKPKSEKQQQDAAASKQASKECGAKEWSLVV